MKDNSDTLDNNRIKVTLILDKSVLDQLDNLAKETKTGSRGRVIEFMVNDYPRLQRHYEYLKKFLYKQTQKH